MTDGPDIPIESFGYERFGPPLAALGKCPYDGLPSTVSKSWPTRFMYAANLDADLSRVSWQFLHWLLTDPVVNPGIDHPVVRDAVGHCAKVLLGLLTNGQPLDERATLTARQRAQSAVLQAARAAGRASERTVKSTYLRPLSGEYAMLRAARYAACAAECAAECAALVLEEMPLCQTAAELAEWRAGNVAQYIEAVPSNAAESAAQAARGKGSAHQSLRTAMRTPAKWARDIMWGAATAWEAEKTARGTAYCLMADKLIALIEAAPSKR